MPRWFSAAFFDAAAPQLPQSACFDHLFAGLTALADWIGSDAVRFPFVADLDRNYMDRARERASVALAAFGLDATRQRAARTARATFKDVSDHRSPNAQQALVGDTSLDAPVVILEAETGSGKTEAALWRYAQLFETGRVDGLYFAVPTRAAAVQLHGRIVKAAARLFGDATPQPILAVPGYLRAAEANGTPLPGWQVRWDDDADEQTLAARWAAEDSKRYLGAQIAVGTVDQAMLGVLMVKHSHLRAASLSRSLLVIDEVHASDRFMTTIQQRLLDAHRSVGGYAMLMSATLGSTARAVWLGHVAPTFAEAVATPYPAVWTNDANEPRTPTEPAARTKDVILETLPTMAADKVASRALEAARGGARVLVIRNTVKAAIETLIALEALAGPSDHPFLFKIGNVVTLHHSRFAPSDRRRLDAAVEHDLAPISDRSPGGRIVIGTQTLEQSLDIDADLLLTDLCPVDVLLQRIGRLHRHDLARPIGYSAPRCVVMVTERGLEALLKPEFENGLGAWRSQDGTLQGVYRDLAILELTRRLIATHPTWAIPAMNRFLVEAATHGAAIERLHAELGPAWRKYHQDVVAGELAQGMVARLYTIDRHKRFDELAFPSDEERIRTRLGEEGARIMFAEPHPTGPFGEPVSEVVLPAHLSRGLLVDDAPIVESTEVGWFTFAIGHRRFDYDRHGVRPARQANEHSDGSID